MMKLKKMAMAGLVVSGGILLSACGGGGSSSPAMVAQTNTTATIDKTSGAAIVPAVIDKPITFSSGVPLLGTSSSTTVTIGGTGAAPTFNIGSAGATATGDMTFGSCIFTVKASTFPAGHALALGQVTTINPCSLTVGTSGTPVGTSTNLPVTLVLGTTSSAALTLPALIGSNGSVAVNGATVGTTPVVSATGAGG